MYNRSAVEKLLDFLRNAGGKLDKAGLSDIVQRSFDLTRDRSVFSCEDFSIRFCHAKHKNLCNTVLSLSALQKYDNRPFVVCIVTPAENFVLLANSTFLSKISHSSQQLRINNIKGSFNGSDIMRFIDGMENSPENFEALFLMHESFAFAENLERLVEKTNDVVPAGRRFEPSEDEVVVIREAPIRASLFLASTERSHCFIGPAVIPEV